MISKIEAFRYRCFDHLDIEMGHYHVLAGANGSGKSTLLDIPLLLGDMLVRGVVPAFLEAPLLGGNARSQSLQELVHYGRGDYFGFAIEATLPENVARELIEVSARSVQLDPKKQPYALRYEIRFQIFNYVELHIIDELFHVMPRQVLEPEMGWGIGGKRPASWLTFIERESGAPASLSPETIKRRQKLTLKLEPQELALANVPKDVQQFPAMVWFRELLEKGAMQYRPNWSLLRKACPPGQPKTIRADGANLPWLILSLKQQQPDLFEAWVEHVKIALPNVSRIDAVEREEDHHAYVRVEYCGGYGVTSSGLSEGTLHILAMTIIPYLSNAPPLICLEEPENGIHPRAIEVVLQSLSSVYDSQVWLSTHSPVVLAHTELASVIVMRSSQENSVEAIRGNEHPRLQDWRGSIDLGSLFAAGVLG